MRFVFLTLLFFFCSSIGAYCNTPLHHSTVETQNPIFLNLPALIKVAEVHLDKWQVKEASQIADKAIELASNPNDKSRALYLKSQVEFYKGNYNEAVRYGKEAYTLYRGKEISDFLDYASKVAKTGEKFKEVKTEHFIIRYIHPKDSILPVYAQKTLEKAYYEIGSDLGTYPSDPVIVEIYPDPESFAIASTLSQKDIATTGVVGICKFNRLMVISPRLLPQGYMWLDALAHEYTHYLVFLKSENTVPVWLHEGIAKFEEKRWREKKRQVLSPFYETLLARALKENSLVPIEKMHPSFGKLESAYEAQLAFAQVGTIIDFIVRKWGSGALLNLLESLREKNDYRSAIKQVTKMDFPDFYKSWTGDLRRRKLTEKIPGLKVKELKFEEDKGKSGDKGHDLGDLSNAQARDYTTLGDMLKDRGRLKAAAYEYDKALNFDPVSPIILNRLASTQSALGEYEKAEELLTRSVKFYPEFVDTYNNLGGIYLKKENLKKAEESYQSAISINPFDPEPHIALISIYEKLGLSDSAESERRVLGILVKED
jgi:tetratricopeptide (TPR) repeat protein